MLNDQSLQKRLDDDYNDAKKDDPNVMEKFQELLIERSKFIPPSDFDQNL